MTGIRWALGLLLIGLSTSVAQAQYPRPNVGVLPNYFNRQVQPISPYLRLVQPLNPAVNYYYDVRPAVEYSNPARPTTLQSFMPTAQRQTFFPRVDTLSSLTGDQAQEGQQAATPTGHPIGFGNTLGYYPRAVPPGAVGGGVGPNR